MTLFRLLFPFTVDLNPLGLHSRFGGKFLIIWLVCPQNGTAVLKGLTRSVFQFFFSFFPKFRYFSEKQSSLRSRPLPPFSFFFLSDNCRASDPGSHTIHYAQQAPRPPPSLPITVSAFVFIARNTSAIFPSSTRVEITIIVRVPGIRMPQKL